MDHISRKFDQHLAQLHSKLGELGSLVVSTMNAIPLFSSQVQQDQVQGQPDWNARLQHAEAQIHAVFLLEAQIDEECERIIALHQPVASDLRTVIAVIRTLSEIQAIANSLEQMIKLISRARHQRSPTAWDKFINLGSQTAILTGLAIRSTMQIMAKSDLNQGETLIKQYRITKKSYKRLQKTLDAAEIHADQTLAYCFRLAQEFLHIIKHNKLMIGHLIYLIEGTDVRHLSFKQMRDMLELSLDHD